MKKAGLLLLCALAFSCASPKGGGVEGRGWKAYGDGCVKNLTWMPMSKVVGDGVFGELVDVKNPSRLQPCYTFVFKSGGYLYDVLAMTEHGWLFARPGDLELDKYTAIGLFGVRTADGEVLQNALRRGNCGKYSFLDDLPLYTTIGQIESRLKLPLVKRQPYGFIFPFYDFVYDDGEGILEIICTPDRRKDECLFAGGWAYTKSEDRP